MAASTPAAHPATPIGALEEQLQALQHTKADMRTLRAHMAGLEDELERLTTANESLRRDLAQKNTLNERQMRRIESQQERIFALEADAEAAADLRTSVINVREEGSKWKERCLGAEQRLAEIGRSHELLRATVVGTCDRLLSPYGTSVHEAPQPLAWQQQLHAELSAVVQAPLVAQASRDVQSAHAHAASTAPAASTGPKTPATSRHAAAAEPPQQQREQQQEQQRRRGGWTPASGRIERGWRRRGEEAAAGGGGGGGGEGAGSTRRALHASAAGGGGGGGGGDDDDDRDGDDDDDDGGGDAAFGVHGEPAWWLATATELRVERGQLTALVEQRRREHRIERRLLREELDVAERQWPTAALALRRCLQPVLSDLAAIPLASRREADAAEAEAEAEAERLAAARLAEAAAAAETAAAELEQARLAIAAVEAQLVEERARADAAETACSAEVRQRVAVERQSEAGRLQAHERQASARLRSLDALRERPASRHRPGPPRRRPAFACSMHLPVSLAE